MDLSSTRIFNSESGYVAVDAEEMDMERKGHGLYRTVCRLCHLNFPIGGPTHGSVPVDHIHSLHTYEGFFHMSVILPTQFMIQNRCTTENLSLLEIYEVPV